jgi:ubiquitin-protein ligase
MSNQAERAARIDRELKLLERLKKSSSIFDFQTIGDPIDEIVLIFNGQGLFLEDSVDDDVEYVEVHRIVVRLPTSFPKTEPDVRWQTKIFHPNISFSGLVDWEELGLKWQTEMTLDVLADRLWDVARIAFLNLNAASNYTAKKWYENECTIKLPVDPRPLHDLATSRPQNVVTFRRRGDQSEPSSDRSDIMFIGEESTHSELVIEGEALDEVSDEALPQENPGQLQTPEKSDSTRQTSSTSNKPADEGIQFID